LNKRKSRIIILFTYLLIMFGIMLIMIKDLNYLIFASTIIFAALLLEIVNILYEWALPLKEA
jgi:hypothetical protein